MIEFTVGDYVVTDEWIGLCLVEKVNPKSLVLQWLNPTVKNFVCRTRKHKKYVRLATTDEISKGYAIDSV